MSSGMKKLVFNTRERAISPDVNRAQDFKARDVAELFRYFLDVVGNDDLDAGAVVTEPNTLEAPLRAEIFNGLLVRPQGGVLDLFVDPGVLYAIAPDAGADDSNYKYIHDAGITTLGSLLMTTNPAGTIRIDVIECRIHPTELIISDSRDIFNPSTGLFTASSVTKERTGRLEYRVRVGVAGAGYPAPAAGWLPIAVASLAPATVNNDTITFWDVRPLISDRELGQANLTNDHPRHRRRQLSCDTINNGFAAIVNGTVDVLFKGRRVGGRLRRGSPGADVLVAFDATGAEFAPGFVSPTNGFVNVYLCFPFGLPRWARYTDGPAGRVPRSPKGLPVVSETTATVTGQASVAIALPAVSGLLGSTIDAVSILTIPTGAGGALRSCVSAGPETIVSASEGGVLPYDPAIKVAGTYNGVTATFTLTTGTHFPRNARRLLIQMRVSVVNNTGVTQHYYIDYTGTSGEYLEVLAFTQVVANAGNGIAYIPLSPSHMLATAAGTAVGTVWAWIPIPPAYPAGLPASIQVSWIKCLNPIPGGVGASDTPLAELTVCGWDTSP